MGTWRQVPPPARAEPIVEFDPVRQRMLVLCGFDLHYENDVWSISLGTAAQPVWTKLDSLGTPPRGRKAACSIYDPVRDRVVLFGGRTDNNAVLGDVWALELSGATRWLQLLPAGTPPPAMTWQSAIYDPVRDRMLVYGGYDNLDPLGDVWELTLGDTPTWTRLTIPGPAPLPRYGHSAIYDPVRDRMVIFGGWSGFLGFRRNDIWALSLGGTPQWTDLTPASGSPSERTGHTMIYDHLRDRAVVFGGSAGSTPFNDVWAFSLGGAAGWTQLAPSGTGPAGRWGSRAIYHPGRDAMIVYGGDTSPTNNPFSDVWSLSLGGGTSWSELSPSPPPPALRKWAAAAFDPVGARMLLFGGEWPSFGDVLALSADGGPPNWERLAVEGTPPPWRGGASAIYDASRTRVILFGGGADDAAFNDVWVLDLAATPRWTQLFPAGPSPPGRLNHSAVYDAAGDRMIVFGGCDPALNPIGDTWELLLGGSGAWHALATSGIAPSARFGHAAIIDPIGDRMLLYGGGRFGSYSGDLWSLALTGEPVWSPLDAAGPAPAARAGHTAVYDPGRRRMVVFGGELATSPGVANDVWSLGLVGTPAWTSLPTAASPPAARRYHFSAFDAAHDRMLMFGGGAIFVFNDTWELDWDGAGLPTSVPCGACGQSAIALVTISPNPSDRAVTFHFTLARALPTRVRVYDLAGRVVSTLLDETLEAGPHVLEWARVTGSGRRAAPGVYLCDVRAGGARLVRRFVLLR